MRKLCRELIFWDITVQNVESIAFFKMHVHLREPFRTCANKPAFAKILVIFSAKFWDSTSTQADSPSVHNSQFVRFHAATDSYLLGKKVSFFHDPEISSPY
jgi:hypothetical protein